MTRRRTCCLAAAACAVAAALVGGFARSAASPPRSPASATRDEADPAADAAPGALRASGPPRPRAAAPRPLAAANRDGAEPADATSAAPLDAASGARAPDALTPAPATPGVRAAATFAALAPTEVDDRVAPDAAPPIAVARDDLVGRVGRYGLREAVDPSRTWWHGLARIQRDVADGASPSDDTREPATTAVRGAVVAEDGSPVVGAEVLLYSSFYLRQAYYDHRVRQLGRVRTDAAGGFDLRPVALDTVHFGAAGAVLVTVRHPAYADLVAQPLPAIVPGRESDVGRLVLPTASATVHGTVLDLAERPVAGAVVVVSGQFDPVEYDKTERRVVLDACPAAVTDAEGRYAVTDFAPGVHEVSVHVRLDCVLHVRDRWEGDRAWSPRVRAGHAVRGQVVDPDGRAVAAAVVVGGDNWTPTNADGTYWLDNVRPGPLRLDVFHHAWHHVVRTDVPTDGDDVTLAFERPLPRVTLTVVDASGAPVPVVAVDWTWPPGGGPGPFAPDSRYWHGPGGVFEVIVPEGAVGATVTDASGSVASLAAAHLVHGARETLTLQAPAPPAPAAPDTTPAR